MRTIALTLVVALAPSAWATSITGHVAVAGIDTYNATSVTFENPALVLAATDDLSVMLGNRMITLNNIADFATEPSKTFFTWTNTGVTVDMVIQSLTVQTNNAQFLTLFGTAMISETGFDPTLFDYTFSANRPDGISSFTVNVAPPSIVSEPATLFSLATGFLFIWGIVRIHKRKPTRGVIDGRIHQLSEPDTAATKPAWQAGGTISQQAW